MRLQFLVAGLFSLASPCRILAAGKNGEAETAIRKIIASIDQGQQRPSTSDMVFWSGAYLRPVVLPEKGQPHPGKYAISNRVLGSQKTRTEVIRIVVADSGDLAYEYSKSNLQFDLKAGEHVSNEAGILRVWQKDAGKWRIAAMFTYPYDRVPIPVQDVK